MTPKKKAKEIYLKYRTLNLSTWTNSEDAKKCALIAIDEILQTTLSKLWYINNKVDVLNKFYFEYWQEVKQEIEKI